VPLQKGTNVIRQLAGLAGSLALGIGMAGGMVTFAVDQAHGVPVRTVWKSCPTEDSANCVWDSRHRGNGKGQSLYVGRAGVAHPIPHHIAHSLITGKMQRDYRVCPTPVSSDPVLCFWDDRVWHNRHGDTREIPRNVARYLLSR